jgi:hypothetical protein
MNRRAFVVTSVAASAVGTLSFAAEGNRGRRQDEGRLSRTRGKGVRGPRLPSAS